MKNIICIGKIADGINIRKKPSKYNPNGIDEREDAIKDAIKRSYINSIYISKGNRAYEKISIEELRKL